MQQFKVFLSVEDDDWKKFDPVVTAIRDLISTRGLIIQLDRCPFETDAMSDIRIHIKSCDGADNPRCDFTLSDTDEPEKIVHMMICAKQRRIDAQKERIKAEETQLWKESFKLFPPGQGCCVPSYTLKKP